MARDDDLDEAIEWAAAPRPVCGAGLDHWLGWRPSSCSTCAVYAELMAGLALLED